MKNLFKKFFVLLAIIGAVTVTTNLISPTPTSAVQIDQSNCEFNFLGLTSWNCGIQDINDENTLKANIWLIAANIATDITVIAAYLVIGFVIYGGYQYIFSGGEAGKVETGKKTLNHAFIGLAIALSANIIMSTIRIALLGGNKSIANCASGNCIDDSNMLITNTINWFIGIAGLVAVIFVLYGGILYITSAGDPGKLAKAKQTIIYSLIGLAIVGLSFAITAFMTNVINDANKSESNTSEQNNTPN